MPVAGPVPNPLDNLSQLRASADQASVGFYKSSLKDGTQVTLAATAHAGIYGYAFPQGGASNVSSIVVDVSHVLPSFRGQGLGQGYAGGSIEVFPDGHYEASGIYNNGWNRGELQLFRLCGAV